MSLPPKKQNKQTAAFLLLAPKPTPDPTADDAAKAKSTGGTIAAAALSSSPRDIERGPASPMGDLVVKSPVRRVQPARRAAQQHAGAQQEQQEQQ